MEFSVPMALADFVPVVLFLIGAILLQRELYPRLGKGQFALCSPPVRSTCSVPGRSRRCISCCMRSACAILRSSTRYFSPCSLLASCSRGLRWRRFCSISRKRRPFAASPRLLRYTAARRFSSRSWSSVSDFSTRGSSCSRYGPRSAGSSCYLSCRSYAVSAWAISPRGTFPPRR